MSSDNDITRGLRLGAPPRITTILYASQQPFQNTVARVPFLQPEQCCARSIPIGKDNQCTDPRSVSIVSPQTEISIPDSGIASPYPVSFTVGQDAVVKYLTITLTNYSHTYVGDVGMILEAPDGTTALLWWEEDLDEPAENVTVTLDSHDPGLDRWDGYSSGVFRPSGSDNPQFDHPAPQGIFPSNLNVFNGLCALGTWRLYIQDFAGGDEGSIFSATLNIYL